MPTLSTELRKLLENTVIAAREEAEKAARAALIRLAVSQRSPYATLSPEECALRNRLRAEARRLGETTESQSRDGAGPYPPLVTEVAYAQWHRMLFARFLAENQLLMHPTGVAVTLEECAELAESENEPDAWMLAARYASAMLPGIFPQTDPTVQVRFDAAGRLALERFLNDLPASVFTASDSLGWVYQFWQTKRKKEVNESGAKIGGADLAPVTQLFTEHYMVQFLLHNSLGAWWASRHPGEPLPTDLEFLRRELLPPQEGVQVFGYSGVGEDTPMPNVDRAVNDPSGRRSANRPADGNALKESPPSLVRNERQGKGAGGLGQSEPLPFSAWPERTADLRILDPCCGSAHFLVAAFALLRRFRMAEEGLSEAEAGDAVLRDNLFGLELDPRCTQIAVFALALAAWKAGGYRELPLPHIACAGLPVGSNPYEFTHLADGDSEREAMLRQLHRLFQQGPELGSLIDPVRVAKEEGLYALEWAKVGPLVERMLVRERADDPAAAIFGNAAKGVARAADILTRHYHLVITNVPYLGGGKQDALLRQHIETFHNDAKANLATAFVDRCLRFCTVGGTVALVSQQTWLFLGSYRKLRERLLQRATWNLVARLGPGAFETISGEVVNVALFVLTHATPTSKHTLVGLDASAPRVPAQKAELLRTGPVHIVSQSSQLRNPDFRIALEEAPIGKLLSFYADSYWGLGSGDYPRYGRYFWELPSIHSDWITQLSTVDETIPYGGREHILYWQDGKGDLVNDPSAFVRATHIWGKYGVLISQMRNLPITLYTGEAFDTNCSPIIPKDPAHLPAIWAFCSSREFHDAVRRIDQKLNVTNATLVKVPFDLERWQQVAAEEYPNGLPEPHSDDPTQWLFHGDPARATHPLQVAVARLLGYRWPQNETDALDSFADDDGIVCIPPVAGELPAAQRLRDLLAAAYDFGWTPAQEEKLLQEAGFGGQGLEAWLRDGFFASHCRLFHNRPFLWQIWDGRKDGFSAIVNYHRLDRPKLERLIYTTLGAWIAIQRDADTQGVPGANARLVAALALQEKLKAIAEGEPPYDIFVRWKSLAQQPLGWDPDLNDGVRLNIRPFVKAGILRAKFSVHWNKDRGTNPDGSERLNDLHRTRAEKEAVGNRQ